MINKNFVLSSLEKNPEYYDDVISLIEDQFHYEHNHKFEIDFAPLVNPNNFENCLIIIDKTNRELAAHLGFVKKNFIFQQHELPTILIGGIATKKKYQGNKLFSELISHCFSINPQVGLFLLWSEIQGLYEKFGFTRTGAILETGKNVITDENIPEGYRKTKFHQLSGPEFLEIQKLYTQQLEKKLFTIKRTPKDWDCIQQMSSVDLYIKKNELNEIIAYFCYGKGNDLKQVIHEFVAIDFKTEIKLLEVFKLWLTENYLTEYPNHQLQYNAFFKIGNIEPLNEFLSTTGLIIQKYNHPEISIQFQNQQYNLNYVDFLNGLFGPNPLAEFKSMNLFPYISGLDSI